MTPAAGVEALRRGDARGAWLIADRICRTGSAQHDGHLLRAAAFARLGDAQAAMRDLLAAAHAAPFSSTVNLALLACNQAGPRRAAARRLLLSEKRSDHDAAYRCLAEMGLSCAGRVVVKDKRVVGEVAWSGSAPLAMRLRTDIGETLMELAPSPEPPPSGFDFRASIDEPIPLGSALRVEAGNDGVVLEPGTLALLGEASRGNDAAFASASVKLTIIVPVHDDRRATKACLKSLFLSGFDRRSTRIIVVDDVTPDPALARDLDRLRSKGLVELLRTTLNLGFAGSVNLALRERSPGSHLLILNADTILPHGVIDKLVGQLDADPGIGTVTPLSNNGEDTSFPLRFVTNPLPPAEDIALIDTLAGEENAGKTVDLPNGVGFCLLIRGSVVDALGGLATKFGRGYYEDVEFCLRAADIGYRNVCATDCYVGHHGSRSFLDDKRALVAANLPRLVTQYPGYREAARAFEAADPLAHPIARIEDRLLAAASPFDLIVLPADMPPTLAEVLALNSISRDRRLVTATVDSSGAKVEVRLQASDGGAPQSLSWSFAHATAPDDLAARLAPLAIERLVMIDGTERPSSTAGPLPGLIATSDPAGPLVVLADGCDSADAASIDEIALRWSGEVVIVASDPTAATWREARSFVTGPVPPRDLPAWLARIGPRALLIASKRWGWIDPRGPAWARQGLPIAWFDPEPAYPGRPVEALLFAPDTGAEQAAETLVRWLDEMADRCRAA